MKNESNRREFLGTAGASLAGFAVVSTVIGGLPNAVEAKTSKKRNSMEDWLLSTGKDKISPNIYNAALSK
jgi:hypothetical protein